MIQRFPLAKTLAAVVPVEVVWTNWLGTDDAIETVSVAAPASFTVSAVSTDTKTTTFLLGGGTIGQTETITVTCTSSGGKVEPVYIQTTTRENP